MRIDQPGRQRRSADIWPPAFGALGRPHGLLTYVRGDPGTDGPLLADIVAKVENRTTRRISLKSILRRACCRKARRRQYEGRWSFWYETMWSLMSPHAKRISGL